MIGTESLIEEYLVENYISQAAGSESDRQVAEKAFKAELSNGPEKMIHYLSGSFPKKVGSFDLSNFHRAFDEWFETNGLLDIFTDDGKLVNRGTYARFKDLDKTIPAVKALKQLWGVQFNHDMEFLDDKLVRVKAEEDKAAAKAKLEQDREDCKTRFNDPQILDKVTSTKEWDDLINTYPAEDRADIKPAVYVTFYVESAEPSAVTLQINGIIRPPVGVPGFARIVFEDNDRHVSEDDIIKQITDQKAIADMLVEIKRVYPAAMLMINNYREFEKRPESKEDVIRGFRKNELLIYYNRETGKYYKAIQKVFPYKNSWTPGLMLIDLEDEKFKVGRLTGACVIAAARVDYYETSGRCYSKVSYYDYFNSKLGNPTELTKAGINIKEYQSTNYCDHDVTISDQSNFQCPELSKYFDKEAHFTYECDSSD